MSRIIIGRVHLVAGVLAFALICTFWTSTVVSELFGSAATVAAVKAAILWGMLPDPGHGRGRRHRVPPRRQEQGAACRGESAAGCR